MFLPWIEAIAGFNLFIDCFFLFPLFVHPFFLAAPEDRFSMGMGMGHGGMGVFGRCVCVDPHTHTQSLISH